jgi:uncharacterized protein (TIGR03089 family)
VRHLSQLARWTGGLAGERDPAQPLLTLHDGPARVELSGATVGNWVAKSANLLVDGYGGPQRIGLCLPLHWQTVCLVLAGVATGATVVLTDDPAALAGCELALTTVEASAAALDAGVDDVLALSGHPLGAPADALPTGVDDYAREVPSYGDSWGGPPPDEVLVEVAGRPVEPRATGLTTADRVLVHVAPADPAGLALLLGCLRDGAALVLVPDPGAVDLAAVAGSERVTATAGLHVAGLPRLDAA